MTKKSLILIFLPVICLLCQCQDSPSEGDAISLNRLLSAPEQINMGDYDLRLETFLWRDFMPMVDTSGNGLIALIDVIATDSSDIASFLEADTIWVIDGETIWQAPLYEEGGLHFPNYLIRRIARQGPYWEPHINVDVVVRIVDTGGNSWLLQASDQWIHRTD